MKKLTYWPDQNSLAYLEVVSDYVDSKTVAPGVAKTFAKPATARFVRLSAGQLFYYRVGGVAVSSPTDVNDGTGSISVPATVQPFFSVDDLANISVVSPSAGVISAEWWS
jgi:hypothetical protein